MNKLLEKFRKKFPYTVCIIEIYIQNFSKRSFCILLSLSLIVTIFNEPLKRPLLTFTNVIFKDLPNKDVFRSYVVLFLLIYSLFVFINNNIRKHRYPTANSILFAVTFYCIYIIWFRNSPNFYYFKWFESNIYILDIIYIAIIILGIFDYQTITPPLKHKESFILEDNVDLEELENDILARNTFAESISQIINETTPNKAIAIAIVSKWGFGKTVFLKQLEKELTRDNSSNIVLNFNPWKADINVNVFQLFFEELSEVLAPYNNSFIKQTKSYSQKLTESEDGDSTLIKISKIVFGGIFFNSLSLPKQYEELNKSIQRIGKRIIVIIDDLDRLSGDEITLIMRLIRNIADFQNVIFVAAFDRSYVVNTLSKADKLTKEEKYIEKIFQVEIPLPPIKDDIIIEELKRLSEPFLLKEDFNELESWTSNVLNITNSHTSKIKSLIYKFLKNIRDIRRFINSLKITYSLVKEELLFEDVFVLELIKFKSTFVYDLLAYSSCLESPSGYYIEFSEKNFDKMTKQINESELDYTFEEIKCAISFLYDHSGLDGGLRKEKSTRLARPLLKKDNHYLYFNYQLFGTFSMKKFKEASENLELLQELIEDKKEKIDDYIEIVQKEKNRGFDNISQNLLKSLIFCNKHISTTFQHQSLRNAITSFISTQYQHSNTDTTTKINKFLKEFLLSNLFPEEEIKTHLLRSDVTIDLLKNHLLDIQDTSLTKILEKETLININQEIFDSYLESFGSNEKEVYSLLKNNYENTEILNKHCCKKYREFLDSNYTWYMQNLIKPYDEPFHKYTFEPFISQIFGEYNEFEDFLNKIPEDKEGFRAYNQLKFKEFKANGYRPIIIPDFRESGPYRE